MVASSKEAQQYLAVAKARKSLVALRGLGGSTWGASLGAMR
ncbi:hypothetical protein EYZ11_013086 [Aspergillus tanneri]|uniref:Uncharacterized protein n=1 Tax=Aspergillus tanneri TaxID=1220188 RepID=A0A4S3J0Q8_9EURO|nr:hypothetical protein EYZ11_013086 [Aspergillus tanneri]